MLGVESIIEYDDEVHYNVRLLFVPRVGERIELQSLVETANGKPQPKPSEVTAVIHQLIDVKDEHGGGHSVKIIVKAVS